MSNRRSWLIPVGLVVAAWGLGLLATWIVITDEETPTTIAAETTVTTRSTLLAPPISETFVPSTAGTTSSTTAPTTAGSVPTTGISPIIEAAPEAVDRIEMLTDKLRGGLGVPPLATEAGLQAYAQAWAGHMASAGILSHSDITVLLGDWVVVGENVGTGGNASAVFQGMVDSEPHYLTMTSVDYTAGGVGAVLDGEGRLWVCQVFASHLLPTTTVPTLPPITLPTVTVPTLPLPTLPTITVPTLPGN